MDIYIKKNLGKGEISILETGLRRWVLFFMVLSISTVLFFTPLAVYELSIKNQLNLQALIILISLILVIIAFVFLRELMKKIYVTNKRIVGVAGIFCKSTLDAPLNKIQTVAVKRTLLGQLFNFGTIVISTANGKFRLRWIEDINNFKNIILSQLDEYENNRIR